ncbi:MAG TPA: Trp biosynthesis-associated membrane protein [Geodermatophilus sp.]|nr:Trp biosynthesis-associated membrane protein [Geodermatophilus sp.]
MSALARARRELTAAVAAAAAAGGLALSTGGQTWATATVLRRPPLPPATEALTGGTLAPLVPAAGLLLLAAAVALVAVRGAARTVVGLLAALAGGVLAWSGLRALAADPVATAGDALGPQTPGSELAVAVHPAWPVLALVAGLLAVLAGGLVVVRGRGWPAMGRRYERPGTPAPARPETAEDRALAAWRALDRGEDPTDPAPEPPGGEPGTRPG